jgi:hypothetical protein
MGGRWSATDRPPTLEQMKTGTSTGTIIHTARSDKKRRRRKQREEARWAALCGPVTTYTDESVRLASYASPTAPAT